MNICIRIQVCKKGNFCPYIKKKLWYFFHILLYSQKVTERKLEFTQKYPICYYIYISIAVWIYETITYFEQKFFKIIKLLYKYWKLSKPKVS